MTDDLFDEAREVAHDLARARCGDDGEFCGQPGCPVCAAEELREAIATYVGWCSFCGQESHFRVSESRRDDATFGELYSDCCGAPEVR